MDNRFYVLKLLFALALLQGLVLSNGYRTPAPDFSNEPATTLPPLTPQQQIYVNMINAVNGKPTGGATNIVQAVATG